MRFFYLAMLLLMSVPARAESKIIRLVCTYTHTSIGSGPRNEVLHEQDLVSVTYAADGHADIVITDGSLKTTEYKGKVTAETISGTSSQNPEHGEDVRTVTINRYTGDSITSQSFYGYPEMDTLYAYGTCKLTVQPKF